MMFSRIGRSLSQPTRRRIVRSGVLGGSVGNSSLNGGILGSYLYGNTSIVTGGEDVGLKFIRGYLRYLGANKGVFSKPNFFDSGFALGHPGFRRLFSSEAPKKKNYENFYPKDKKEIPKDSNQKTESSKEESGTEDQGSFQDNLLKQFQNYITPLLFIGLVLSSFNFGPSDQKQVLNATPLRKKTYIQHPGGWPYDPGLPALIGGNARQPGECQHRAMTNNKLKKQLAEAAIHVKMKPTQASLLTCSFHWNARFRHWLDYEFYMHS